MSEHDKKRILRGDYYEDRYLLRLLGEEVAIPKEILRQDYYFTFLIGVNDYLPKPETRRDRYLYALWQKKAKMEGGASDE